MSKTPKTFSEKVRLKDHAVMTDIIKI